MTATYMGRAARGPPDGDERPLPGPAPAADEPARSHTARNTSGEGQPRPLRVLPGGVSARLWGAPRWRRGTTRHPMGMGTRRRVHPGSRSGVSARRDPPRVARGGLVAAVLALAILLAGWRDRRVVADRRPGQHLVHRCRQPPRRRGRSRPAPPLAGRGHHGTGEMSSSMVTGAEALWVAGNEQVPRIDPATNSVVATIPVAATGAGPAGVAVGAGAVWVPVAVPGALWGIDPATDKVTSKISLGGPLSGSISVGAAGDTVWVACCGRSSTGASTSERRLLRIDPRRKRSSPTSPEREPGCHRADTPPRGGHRRREVLMANPKRTGHGHHKRRGPLGFDHTIAVGASGAGWPTRSTSSSFGSTRRTGGVMARIPAGAVTTLAVTWRRGALSYLGWSRSTPPRSGSRSSTRIPPAPRPAHRRGCRSPRDRGWSSVSRIDPTLAAS